MQQLVASNRRSGSRKTCRPFSAKPRLRLLLDHFSKIKDTRQAWKVAYPLREVLFLVVCGTIASGDDYDDIADWGEAHLSFLRGFAEFHYGIPCADWLRTVMNRNPDSRNSPPSPWSRAALSAATRSRPNNDPISPPACSRLQPSPTEHEAIGRSKTTFTGPST
jgi:hypothetical protein